jgi:3-oxoadipate enol-lactonase
MSANPMEQKTEQPLFVDVRGSRVHYRFDGPTDAPVVIFSNSLGTNLKMWDPQIPALTRQFRVLRYDTRGHGLTQVTPGPYTIEGLGLDVVSLLDALGIAQANYCGLSMGGMIGIWLGIHAAERFRAIAICNTAARVGSTELWNTRIAGVRDNGMTLLAPATIQRWYTSAFIARAPDVIESTQRMLLETSPQGYIAGCEAIRDGDFRDQLDAVKSRTLVISGTHDPITTPIDGRFLAEHIAGAQYVELNAAHLSNVEASAHFSDALLKFLAG